MFNTAHIHPILVHFPIALTLVGFLFECTVTFFIRKDTRYSASGICLLFIATISAVAAVLSGGLFTAEFSGQLHELREHHALVATISTLLLIITSAIYLASLYSKGHANNLRKIGFAFYFISTLFIGITGYLGGELVYSYLIRC